MRSEEAKTKKKKEQTEKNKNKTSKSREGMKRIEVATLAAGAAAGAEASRMLPDHPETTPGVASSPRTCLPPATYLCYL